MPLSKLARKRLKAEQQRGDAVRLRLAGCSFQEVATELKVSKKYAWTLVQSGYKRLVEETNEQTTILRAKEVARLDRALTEIYSIITAVEKDPDSGDLLPKHTAFEKLAAIDRLHANVAARCRIQGTNAPVKATLTNFPDLGDKDPTPEDAAAIVRELFKGHVAPPVHAAPPPDADGGTAPPAPPPPPPDDVADADPEDEPE